MSHINPFISIVVPTYNDERLISSFIDELSDFLQESYADYEIIIVDRASSDETLTKIDNKLSTVPSIRLLILSEKSNIDLAVSAGFENAIGDIIIHLSIDNDPIPSLTPAIKMMENNDLITGVSKDNFGIIYSMMSYSYHLLFSNIINYNLPRKSTSLRLISRRALNATLSRNRHRNNMFVDMSRIGYKKDIYQYHQLTRSGTTPKKSLFRSFRKALSILISNSTYPLRMINLLGIVGSVIGIIISIYSILIKIFREDVIEGWTSLSLFISVQFAMLFLILFMYGEYLARLVEESNEARGCDVSSERCSSVMLNENRWNIAKDTYKNG